MSAALHLHLHYPDVALELIGRVAALGAVPLAIYATTTAPLPPNVAAALAALPLPVETIVVDNRGWDIAPLFAVLPRIVAAGHDVVGHLHTKRGDSGYAAEWRAIAYEGTIPDAAGVDRILAAFAAEPALQLAGPAALYKSAASHQFANAEQVATLAPCLVAPRYPPSDWGFFAGTFFWARITLIERVAALAAFTGADGARDGTLAHALERLFGLAPVATGGAVGLLGDDGSVEIVRAPGRPSHEPIIRTLVDRAERQTGPLDPALAALIARRNPLADYARHGRDPDALDPNPYFSSAFYNRIHEDVFAAGMHPLHHYLHHGWPEGRATGPLFDGKFYRARHSDVEGDPLRHFLEVGAGEGRVAIPVSRPEHDGDEDRPRRFYRHFDAAAEEAFLSAVAALPAEVTAPADSTPVSVIMPVWNRAGSVGAAIRSVLGQTHRALELIVVDDGSADGTAEAVRPFLADPRVRLIEAPHGGVSAARNRGLAAATGTLTAYLDSDNRWVPWFLEVTVRHMTAGRLEAAYAGIALRDDLGQLTGYRGDGFDWDACLEQNYVDLNAFVHARGLADGGFDPALRRMVDWDFILRLTKGRRVGYAPFVGVDYHDGKGSDRVTTAEPSAFQKLVQTRHRTGHAIGTRAFADALSLSIAIKIAAPEAEKEAWGDYHFAEALAAAFRRLGHMAHVDFRGCWTGRPTTEEDVVLALRGLIPHEPRPGQLAVLWMISHPDQVPPEEVDRHTLVYTASESHAALLDPLVRPPVRPLLQATDPARFHPVEADGPPLLFVGNSRGVEREVVRWAIEAGHPPVVYGDGWDGLIPDGLVAAPNLPNEEVGRLYAGAGAVLNDHWPSMRAFGYLSNRLFDIVAAGGRAISDPVPSMAAVFGDAVTPVDGPAALARALARPRPRDRDAATRVAAEHSFDVRAKAILDDVLGVLGVAPRPMPATPKGALRVHALVPHGPHGPQSSATIRLLAPLTDESVSGRIALTLGRAEEDLPDCAVCIVQRTALPDVAAADALVRTLGARGAVLVTEVDDAFCALGDHPEADAYAPLAAALERAVAASAEAWFSTEPLARLYANVAGRRWVRPNALDPRLWRDWRHPRPPAFQGERVRMLCMGTATHGDDFARLRPALDALWAERPGAFDVTVVGVAPDLDPAPWLHRLAVPAKAIPYARFVRWLRGQGPFDVGLAPLADTPFNRAKSDVKLLDYAALGLLPVVEDAPAYRADPGWDGLAVHASDWLASLRDVLDSRDAGRAAACHARLWAERTVERVAPAMVERLEELAR